MEAGSGMEWLCKRNRMLCLPFFAIVVAKLGWYWQKVKGDAQTQLMLTMVPEM